MVTYRVDDISVLSLIEASKKWQPKVLVNNNDSYSTPHRFRVQGAHEFLVAKGIEYDERDIFEFFSVT